jgi:hypothetical protein
VRVIVMGANCCQQIADVVVVKPVEGVPPSSTDSDETGLTKEPQLLGGGARTHPRLGDELLNCPLFAAHRPEQAEAAGGAKGAHRLGERLCFFA